VVGIIPLSIPNFSGNELKYVSEAVSQTWVSAGGPFVTKFEEAMARYVNMPGAVACQSGTAALHLALLECGVKPGDRVLAPTLTFIAAVNPITYVQAQPVFLDCDDSLCIDPEKLEKFCRTECSIIDGALIHKASGKHIPAIIVVHVFGNMADMEAILDIAQRYHLKVIEDATEAIGTYYTAGRYKGRMAGTMGDIGAYSFNGNKIITTGGGGMLVSNDAAALKHMKYLSTQAKDDEVFFVHHEVGYNYRMTNLQAALGLAQLEQLEGFIAVKKENYDLYCGVFGMNGKARMLPFRKDIRSNLWFYSLCCEPEILDGGIEVFIRKLQALDIQTRPVWRLIHEQKPYRENIAYEIEKATYYANRIINIPCSTNLTETQAQQVAGTIQSLLRGK
jgi:perosamine synthetase